MMYALVDINGAFVSMEMVFNPGDRFRPAVVLSNGDGCPIAANRICKDLPGFELYKPAFMQEQIMKLYNVLRFSPNFEFYVDMSRRFIEELRYFSDRVEMYSIDEAFLDLDFIFICLTEYGHRIRQTILKHLGLPVGIGIAATKTLCKVASRIAKKFIDRTGGVYVIDSEELRIKALKWLKVGDVWGIANATVQKLHAIKVFTAYQFTQLPDSWVLKHMTIVGLRIKQELLGVSCMDITQLVEPKKEIGTATQFGEMITDYPLIREATCCKMDYLAGKLRRQNSVASAIKIHLETNSFSMLDEQYYNGTVITLDVASSDTNYLIKNACIGLDRIFKQGMRYKRVGISLIGLFPDTCVQQNLFVDTNPKHTVLQKVIDKLNMKYEQGTVRSASCGYNEDKWKSKALARTKRYTTRLNEIPIIGEDALLKYVS